MNTGASIFFSLLLLFAALIGLGFLASHTMEISTELKQLRNQYVQLQSDCALRGQELNDYQAETQRLGNENLTLKHQLQEIIGTLEAEQQARQAQDAEIARLQGELERTRQERDAAWQERDIALAQAQQAQNALQGERDRVRAVEVEKQRSLADLEAARQAGRVFQLLEGWLRRDPSGLLAAGVLTGGSLAAAGAGLTYVRMKRLKARPRALVPNASRKNSHRQSQAGPDRVWVCMTPEQARRYGRMLRRVELN